MHKSTSRSLCDSILLVRRHMATISFQSCFIRIAQFKMPCYAMSCHAIKNCAPDDRLSADDYNKQNRSSEEQNRSSEEETKIKLPSIYNYIHAREPSHGWYR